MNKTFCQYRSFLTDPTIWYVLLVTLSLIGIIIFSIKLDKKFLSRFKSVNIVIRSAIAVVTFIFVFMTLSIGFILIYGEGIPASSGFHNLNAAVKNTCYLDPLQRHCPRTVQDLINIQAETFRPQTENAALTYEYYPETNQYTLIVRRKSNTKEVVIFDPRLATEPNTDTHFMHGANLDFTDTGIYECQGKYYLWTEPPFPGPWDRIN